MTSVKNKVARVKTAVTGAWNRIKSAAQTVSDAGRTVHTERIVGETESQWKNRVAQEKAKKSSAKADLASIPLNLYEGTKGFLNRKLEECADQIDSSIFGSAVYTAADLVCQAEQKACKGFSYCYNSVQQKIPDKDLSRILKGVGLIAVGAGKVTGAVALAAISAPFCGAVVGVAGEAAAGITAAAGGGDIAQGLQEIMCGWNGDSESESYNLVRDTLYSGNETAYQISTVTGEAAEEAVKQSTKDALEDAAGETAIENLDGIEGIGKGGSKTVKYSPIKPCNEISQEVAESFNGATFTKTTLTEDTVMYRVSGGKAGEVGSYVSRMPQGGGLQSQLDLALNPSWGNTTENITKVVVPKGTTIYEGIAAPQNIYDSLGNVIGTLPGGGNQVYIPKVEAGWFK